MTQPPRRYSPMNITKLPKTPNNKISEKMTYFKLYVPFLILNIKNTDANKQRLRVMKYNPNGTSTTKKLQKAKNGYKKKPFPSESTM